MIALAIDSRSAIPPFEQLRMQFVELIRVRQLAPGVRLPTVRKLADDLAMAPNTVARTYRELEQAGLIETRGRHGTFVTNSADPVRRQAELATAHFVDQMVKLSLSPVEVIALVRAALPAERFDPS